MNFINQFNQRQVKKHSLITILGIALGLLLYYYFESSNTTESQNFASLDATLSAFGGIVLAYVVYWISRRLDKAIPWKTQLSNRFISGLVIQFLVSFLLSFGFVYLYKRLVGSSFSEELLQSGLIKLAIILFLVILLYTIFYFALYSYYAFAKFQIDSIAYDRKQIDLQLKALKSQLSSHFLFNNLNTLSSLVYKDEKLAEDYTRGLATIYNYTLNSYNTKLVSLSEELNFVNSYLLLLKTRFGTAFNYNISIPEHIRTSNIPPLTLQMLIENSVKHNQMDLNGGLQIDIQSDGKNISVRNNITKAPEHVKSFNIGLKNIESRYRLLCNKSIAITKDTHFTVEFPVINT